MKPQSCVQCHIVFTEMGDTKTKIEALKKTIQLILNGEKMPSLLMTIIRFVMPLQDHTIKKLLLIFWEVVPKYSPDGSLIHEMILVCDAYRKVSTSTACAEEIYRQGHFRQFYLFQFYPAHPVCLLSMTQPKLSHVFQN